ncbi:uncharacterized protein LOC143297069 [Babylonia areolata]|uniref:uncharacterized protein LOC143297069 n=1 Tax=Babylonia areolata TaxID=304850 RepID=UPI003FD24227
MALRVKHGEINKDPEHLGKTSDSASDENSDASSDDCFDEKENSPLTKRAKLEEDGDEDEDDDDDDEKGRTDDGEHSDSAALRQSKRKPSKSRIKRIVPQQQGAGVGLSPDAGFPLPSMDSLMMGGGSATMVGGLAQGYLQQMTGGQMRTPGGYKCEVCGKEFRVPSRYDSHMLSHSKGKPYCCDVCGKLFASQQKLDIHKPVHSRDRKESLECPTCGQKCNNWRSYLYHVSKHTTNGGKKHTCEACGRQFHAAQRLRNHMQSHIDGKNFCCLICGKLFESQKRLDTHSLIHDAERQEPFSCVDCGKIYDDWRAFKQHMKTHGSDGVIYRCEICSAQFHTQYEKEKHKRVHTSDQRYQCHQCSKCFRSQSQLSVHERKHLGNKSHECMICGRECARASSLKAHMKLHVGEEEFFCHVCGRTFKEAEDLTVHAACHVGARDFTCDQCGKAFAKKIHYHRHLVVHASGQPLICLHCGKQFEHPTQLHSHMLTHGTNGQPRFACLACSDAFDSQLELEAHAHTHGRQPPYVCGLCGKLFAEQRYFRQHMKRHTARALKQKMLQGQGASPATPSSVSRGSGAAMPTKLEHKCHMCGQQFAQRHSLISHIEEHKRSGLFVYFNMYDSNNPMKKAALQQKSQGPAGASDDESESDSESEGSDETPNRSKTTIHFGMKGSSQSGSTPRGSNSRSSLTQAAERAMALRMQAAAKQSQLSGANDNGAPRSRSIHSGMSMQNPGDGGESEEHKSSFYSAPVFPGQMSGSHATPYHAAAQQFQQQNSQEDFMDGSNQGGGDAAGQYASQQKGLPGFADFRRQLGFSDGAGYAEYPNNMPASDHYAPAGQMPPSSSGYSNSSAVHSPSSYLPSANDQMAVPYSTSSSVPVYPDMSVFPGMPAPGPDRMGRVGQNPQGGDMQQQQYEPMLQFQPLSS